MLTSVERFLHWLSAIAIAVTTAIVVVDVFLAMAQRTTYVSAEIGPFLMAIIVFFAVPTVTREDGHIRADFFDSLFPSGGRLVFKLFLTDILFLLYAAVLLWAAAEMTSNAFLGGERTQGLLRTPLWIPELGMVLGLFILLLRTMIILKNRAVRFGKGIPNEGSETR